MTTILQHLVDRKVIVLASDGRLFYGNFKSFDQSTNVLMTDCTERIYSLDSGVEFIPLGLYILRGENITMIGEMDEDIEKRINFSSIRSAPIQPVRFQMIK